MADDSIRELMNRLQKVLRLESDVTMRKVKLRDLSREDIASHDALLARLEELSIKEAKLVLDRKEIEVASQRWWSDVREKYHLEEEERLNYEDGVVYRVVERRTENEEKD